MIPPLFVPQVWWSALPHTSSTISLQCSAKFIANKYVMIGLRLSTLPYLVLVVDYRNSHLFLTVCANVCYVSMFTCTLYDYCFDVSAPVF